MTDYLNEHGYGEGAEVKDQNGNVKGHYYENKDAATHTGGIYIPDDMSGVDSVVCCVPGMGGSGAGNYGHYKSEVDKIHDNPPDYVVVICPNDSPNSGLASEVVDAANKNGANVTNVGVVAFSNGGTAGLAMGGTVAADYPETNVRIATVDAYTKDYTDGIGNPNSKYADAIDTNINGGNVTIVSIVPQTANWEREEEYKARCVKMGESGHNSYMITSTNASGHQYYVVDFCEAGGFDWAAGKGGINSDYYITCQCYDPDSGEWVETDIKDVVSVMLDGKVVTADEFTSDDGFEVTEDTPDEVNKYDWIKNIPTDSGVDLSNASGISDAGLISDMQYVNSSMSALRTQIKSSNFLSGKTTKYRSSTGIPGCISSYINRYYDIMGDFMSSFVEETDAIISVGQAIVDMDVDMKRRAEETISEVPEVILSEQNSQPPSP